MWIIRTFLCGTNKSLNFNVSWKGYIEVFHNQDKEIMLVQTAQKGDTIKSIAIEGLELNENEIFE